MRGLCLKEVASIQLEGQLLMHVAIDRKTSVYLIEDDLMMAVVSSTPERYLFLEQIASG